MSDPLVSIVMPAYNHERFVAEAIGSAIDQTFESWELVVTDDGSTDGTVAVIQAFRDPRIRLHAFARNQGVCAALNDAIGRARGRYIAVLNSDDAFLPHKLETQLAHLQADPSLAAVFSWAQFINEESDPVPPGDHFYTGVFDQPYPGRHALLRTFFFDGNCLCHPSVMVRAEVHRDVGLYDPRLAQLHDLDLWVRILLRGHGIDVLSEPLVQFRLLAGERNASGRSVATLTRSHFETRFVLRHFLGIRDPSEFAGIFFPGEVGGAAQLVAEDLPVRLAWLAAESPRQTRREFAAEVLHDVMAGAGAARLAQRYGWTPADYIRLTGALGYAVANTAAPRN